MSIVPKLCNASLHEMTAANTILGHSGPSSNQCKACVQDKKDSYAKKSRGKPMKNPARGVYR